MSQPSEKGHQTVSSYDKKSLTSIKRHQSLLFCYIMS